MFRIRRVMSGSMSSQESPPQPPRQRSRLKKDACLPREIQTIWRRGSEREPSTRRALLESQIVPWWAAAYQ
jgi:hypothetical protein